jgi:NAD(P)-dependent dehydrogenase (short-subunit alcohol dehydrogenase family)
MGSLDGKVALVTGAGSGIGRSAALTLAAAGASVVATDLASEGLDETVVAIESAGGKATPVLGDVRRRGDVAAAVEEARTRFGGLDVVLANAAVSLYEEFELQS